MTSDDFARWLCAQPSLTGSAPTLDLDGLPDARTLILEDVSPRGWAFASTHSSAKGAQLAADRTRRATSAAFAAQR